MRYFIDNIEVDVVELNRFNETELKEEDGYSEFLELDYVDVEKEEIHFVVSGVSQYG